jgi:hypothetical protein
LRPGRDLREQFKPLASQRGFQVGEAGDVPTGAVDPRDEAAGDGVDRGYKDDRDRPRFPLNAHRAAIISAAARNNVPAVYILSDFVRDGGLLSYGPELVDPYRRAATYVDRILRGEKPGDLPVQLPTKFEMVLNRKTAKALGLEIPLSILVRADEVIE